MTNRSDAIVVGGGPAGMMAAITAAERGRSVLLLERNDRLGIKLNITGKGRCNVTNDCQPQEMLQSVPGNSRFLYSALFRFPPRDLMDWFEYRGLPLKTERGNRVFPVSDRAKDVTELLERQMADLGVRVERDRVTELWVEDGLLKGVLGQGGWRYEGESVLLATGGLSYPKTGSTGDGYRLAERQGHRIVEPKASLVPLESPDPDCGRLQGLSLRNVGFRVEDKAGKTVYEDFGELLFTHFGLSGPVVLSASAHLTDFGRRYEAVIDLKPALDEAKLDARLLRLFREHSNRDFVNVLPELCPHSLIPVLLDRSGIPEHEKVHSVTREQRKALLQCLKAFRIPLSGTRPIQEAIVTAGGVAVEEIQPSTMESKLLPGLFFAGELLDLDAYTGGFNLQIAWSTGYAAGCHL